MDVSQVYEKLKKIGFSQIEARIYVVLYEYGLLSPSTISSKLSKNRVTIYHACERMSKKGLINKVPTAHGAKYSARTIADLKNQFNDQLDSYKDELSKKIDKLDSLGSWFSNIATEDYKKPITKVIQGSNALKEIYRLSLETDEILAYFDPWDSKYDKDFKDIDDWHTEERVKRKIPIKIIMPKNKKSVAFSKVKKPYKFTVLIPEDKFPYKDFTIITNNRLLIYSSKDLLGVSITSPNIASNQAVVFSLLWDKLK